MEILLKKLRDRQTDIASFRVASDELCMHLLQELSIILNKKNIPSKDIVLVIILRAAVAFLGPALKCFPEALVGVVGLKRDEKTFFPHWYYENLPPLSKQSVIILLDPMLATGGSAEATVLRLLERGATPKNIYFLGIIGAPEGLARLSSIIPKENIILSAIDQGLDPKKFIVPGLGDFGDRYFGYNSKVSFHKL